MLDRCKLPLITSMEPMEYSKKATTFKLLLDRPEPYMADSPEKNKAQVRFCTLDEGHAGQRLDNFLMSQFRAAPKSLIYRLIRKGEVRVNKKRAKACQRLEVGDLIRIPPVRLPEASTGVFQVSQGLLAHLEAAILFEDDHLLIVNKPAGLAVHGGSGLNFGLIEAIRQLRPDAKRLELVHRLDRDTSGCIVIAKNRQALTALHRLLREKAGINKQYHALVHGIWPESLKKVEVPLQKNVLASGERLVRVDPEGKEALTRFRCLQRFNQAQMSLVEAFPVTGRTHQIRVHALYAEHPIAGDEKYCPTDVSRQSSIRFPRLFLHARCLGFRHPVTGEPIAVEAAYCDKWHATMRLLG
jgi:23S rRNA pseudouridine955/2504/2580 synthase